MRKLNFLLGTIGGMLGGLLVSNKKLRKELRTVKDPSQAAKLLGKELQRGGQEIAKEAKQWIESEETRRGFKRMKRYLRQKWAGVAKEGKHFAAEAGHTAKHKAGVILDRAKEIVEEKMH